MAATIIIMNKNFLQQESGFTLVELLLTIALFSFVVGGVVLLPPLFRSSFNKQQVMLDVNSDGNWAMDRILYDVRNAGKIISPLQNSAAQNLLIHSKTGDSIYYVQKGTRLIRCFNGQCADLINLNKVECASFSVTDLSGQLLTANERVVSVSLKLNHVYNSLGRAEYTYSKTFYGTAMKHI